jgi:molybdate-binding protein/DNA-binding XRE family transcriptional regulator
MSNGQQPANRIKAHRVRRGWSQAELAQRAGISRAAVSAIEIQRLVPSVAAALALAAALGCSVEDLFGSPNEPNWAWAPPADVSRYWHAAVGQRVLAYPVEPTPAWVVRHDGVFRDSAFHPATDDLPESTLVLASCDPAAGLLADLIARKAQVRLLVLPRSSREALSLLRQGLVHMAGVHLGAAGTANGNVREVGQALGDGYRLLRAATWEAGLALNRGLGVHAVQSALDMDLRWVGREVGSGARQCLDELRADRQPPPSRLARDHRGVAEAIRCGWADVGVCLRLTSEEAGLDFLSVRHEYYDLCYAATMEDDPRIRALIAAVQSASYRRLMAELPGYESSDAGDIQSTVSTCQMDDSV